MAGEATTEQQKADDERENRVLLVRVAENRDMAAMERLYHRLRPRLVRFMHRLTADMALIEEAYNDVMLIVWNKAAQYESRAKVSSWVFTIAYRACLRLVKKSQRRNAMIHLTDNEQLDAVSADNAEHIEDNQHLAAAVHQLSAKHRMVIELCYFEGYSIEEIGHIIKCPANTVKTRLHHARKKIKAILAEAQRSLDADTNRGSV